MNSIVPKTGIDSLGGGMTVLGERQVRIPVGGKIRSGIMVLTSTAKQHPKAQGIYDAGVKVGKPWKAIEKELNDACGFEKSPLTPKNVSYFTVRPSDFTAPEAAAEIMKLYGEDGPEGFRLYRFPVIFPVDAWPAVMPHGLHCYTKSELVYWSEYGADGKRYCYTRAQVPIDPQSKRAVRQFGGRPVMPRTDLNPAGLCTPEKCPEYQGKKCNLDGSFIFYIPGLAGLGAVELPTKSFYSLDPARTKFEIVAYLRGGKISGTVNGKPIFYITKKQQEVVMLDDQGKPKKVKQWLIVLEADIDMTRVFQDSEQKALEAGGVRAVAALQAPPADNTEDTDDTAGESAPDDTRAEQQPDPEGEHKDADHPSFEHNELAEDQEDTRTRIKAARKHVADGLNILGVTPEHFAKYGVAKWGAGWSGTLEGLDKAKSVLQQAADDPSALTGIKNWTGE